MSDLAQSLRTPGFSWHSALALASFCRLSYRDRDEIGTALNNDWGMELAAFLEAGATQGFVAENDGVLVVAFRGTESVGDWLIDLDIFATDRSYGAVHGGFLNAYRSIASQFTGRVTQAQSAGKAVWLTGHSLGGSLALIAALERPAHGAFAGIQTFGQPRTVRSIAAPTVAMLSDNGYLRFVNDDDIVARVPPSFHHIGELMHFDHAGNIRSAAFEAVGETGIEPEALTEAEFADLKREIAAIKTATETQVMAEGETAQRGQEVFDASVEGLIFGISDHRLDNYIANIRRYALPGGTDAISELETIQMARSGTGAGVPDTTGRGPASIGLELDRVLRGLDFGADYEAFDLPGDRVAGADGAYEGPAGADGAYEGSSGDRPAPETFPLLLRLRNTAWQPPEGLQVNSRLGNFATVMATPKQLPALEEDPDVVAIEGSRDAGIADLEHSVPFVHGDLLHRPPIAEMGDAAIVGVIDTGIDILHECFLGEDGKTRILAIWNQRTDDGPTPRGMDAGAFSQDYGTVYSGDRIQQMIEAYESNGTPPPALLRDPGRHGTHVASIAAGRDCGTVKSGMAPHAKILVVVPNMVTEPGFPPSLGYSNSHVDALAFMKDVAAGGNALLGEARPIAINVSLGMNAGAHDGSTALEAAFDAVTGGGRLPGCVIVKSAGNERGHGGHASCIAALAVVNIEWESAKVSRAQDYLEAWFDPLDDLTFELVAPNGDRSGVVSFDRPRVSASVGPNRCDLRLTKYHPDNGHNRLTITITPLGGSIMDGRWQLEIVGREIGSTDAKVHIWAERMNSRAICFLNEDAGMTLSIPGTARTVITVGGCSAQRPPRLNPSSSYGLTRDGRPKPEISAPGFQVMAAHAGRTDRTAAVPMTGTSMAAPHVTGALALVLSHRQKQAGAVQFSAVQLLQAVKRTAQNFAHVHNPGYGFGQLDALKLFEELVGGNGNDNT